MNSKISMPRILELILSDLVSQAVDYKFVDS